MQKELIKQFNVYAFYQPADRLKTFRLESFDGKTWEPVYFDDLAYLEYTSLKDVAKKIKQNLPSNYEFLRITSTPSPQAIAGIDATIILHKESGPELIRELDVQERVELTDLIYSLTK